ncbi:uncharacterized protein V1518DRAFT_417841 [Limtongia smithiae]|uniref:uncharacterized protein n=1 Tax=Limtongia smithiae TaxID=1125753 RepID=UPI0034CFF002
MAASAEAGRFGLESQIKRNPHGDFGAVERARAPWEGQETWHYTQRPKVEWTPGSGANDDGWKAHSKIEIDPYGAGRSPVDNYKLLISGIIPRPIGFVSTVARDGTRNLATFSYMTIVNHDPPIFCLGFSGGKGNPKDTARNVLETGELTINVISEWFVEAANFTSINSPPGVDEWKLCGLTPLKSSKVAPEHVAESAFSVEAKLLHSHEWISPSSGKATGTLCICEGVNFHVRDDAINDAKNIIDPAVLQPVSRLGGITYSRTTTGYEMLRPDWSAESQKEEIKELLQE